MPRIIRERYKNGVLIEHTIDGSNFKARKCLILFASPSVIAISLGRAGRRVPIHDSLTFGSGPASGGNLGSQLRAVRVQVVGSGAPCAS